MGLLSDTVREIYGEDDNGYSFWDVSYDSMDSDGNVRRKTTDVVLYANDTQEDAVKRFWENLDLDYPDGNKSMSISIVQVVRKDV